MELTFSVDRGSGGFLLDMKRPGMWRHWTFDSDDQHATEPSVFLYLSVSPVLGENSSAVELQLCVSSVVSLWRCNDLMSLTAAQVCDAPSLSLGTNR